MEVAVLLAFCQIRLLCKRMIHILRAFLVVKSRWVNLFRIVVVFPLQLPPARVHIVCVIGFQVTWTSAYDLLALHPCHLEFRSGTTMQHDSSLWIEFSSLFYYLTIYRTVNLTIRRDYFRDTNRAINWSESMTRFVSNKVQTASCVSIIRQDYLLTSVIILVLWCRLIVLFASFLQTSLLRWLASAHIDFDVNDWDCWSWHSSVTVWIRWLFCFLGFVLKVFKRASIFALDRGVKLPSALIYDSAKFVFLQIQISLLFTDYSKNWKAGLLLIFAVFLGGRAKLVKHWSLETCIFISSSRVILFHCFWKWHFFLLYQSRIIWWTINDRGSFAVLEQFVSRSVLQPRVKKVLRTFKTSDGLGITISLYESIHFSFFASFCISHCVYQDDIFVVFIHVAIRVFLVNMIEISVSTAWSLDRKRWWQFVTEWSTLTH